MKLTDLIPANRKLRERIQQLEDQNRSLRDDPRRSFRTGKEIFVAYAAIDRFLKQHPYSSQIATDADNDMKVIRDALAWVMQHAHPTMTADYLAILGALIQIDDVDISTLTNIINGGPDGRSTPNHG